MSTHSIPPHWDFFGCYVDMGMELEFLEDYVESLDRLLADAAARPASQHPPLPDALLATAADRAELYAEHFPRLVHESFAISTVVFLEHQCRTYVDCLRRAIATPLTLGDLSGSPIDRFKVFCEKVCSLDFGLAPGAWQDVSGIVALRNCLVHSGGQLEKSRDRKEIEAFMKRHKTPEVRHGVLVFSRATSSLCLSFLKAFAEAVYGAALRRFPDEA